MKILGSRLLGQGRKVLAAIRDEGLPVTWDIKFFTKFFALDKSYFHPKLTHLEIPR